MPHRRKSDTSFIEIHRYFFVTFRILAKVATFANELSYDERHLTGSSSVSVPDQR